MTMRIPIAAKRCFLAVGCALIVALSIWPALSAPAGGSLKLPGSPAVLSPATNSTSPDTPELADKALELKLAQARESLATLAAAGGLTNSIPGVSAQDLSIRRALLQRLVRLYEQQLSFRTELESATARKSALVRESEGWRRFPDPPPYSIHLVDQLQEQLQAERLKVSKGEGSAKMLQQLLEENRASLHQSEEKLRQLNERLEAAKEQGVASGLSWQRDMENLRSKVAAATVGALNGEGLILQETLAAGRTHISLLQRKLVLAESSADFSQADLDQALARIEEGRTHIEEELASTQVRRTVAVGALNLAREKLGALKKQTDTEPTADSMAAETVLLWEAGLQTEETAIRVLRLMLENSSLERTMWELRFLSYDSRNTDLLSDSRKRLEALSRRLNLWREHESQQLDVSSSEYQLQETHLNSLLPDSAILTLATQRLTKLQDREDYLLRVVRDIERVQRLTQRWGEGLQMAEARLPLSGRVQNLFSDAHSFLGRLWAFEVFTAEDTITVDGQKISGHRSVTIGKIILALLILVVGYWITGLLTRLLEPVFVKRLKIEANQATLIRRWMRAFLLLCLVLFSLFSVRIPLTIFAFAGGALAIGLGFGTQTLLKNFVSGLIILFERPFRVGDVLDVAGQRGTMTSVGLRASVLQLWDGTETLIPNSHLLENNLTNWTYSSRTVRFAVTVGVSYKSDPRLVIQLLSDVAERHGLVCKEPKPVVLFTEFGESTLIFELRFFVDVTRANSGQVSSDLRLMIATAFAEHAIIIDIPRRSVHLNATQPISVELVQPARFQVSPSS